MLDQLIHPHEKAYLGLRVLHKPGDIGRLQGKIESATQKAVAIYLESPWDIPLASVLKNTRYTQFAINYVYTALGALFRDFAERDGAICWRTNESLKIEAILPELVDILKDPFYRRHAIYVHSQLAQYTPQVVQKLHLESILLRTPVSNLLSAISDLAYDTEDRPRPIPENVTDYLSAESGSIHIKLHIGPLHHRRSQGTDLVLDHGAHVQKGDSQAMYTGIVKLVRAKLDENFKIEALVDSSIFLGPKTVEDLMEDETRLEYWYEDGDKVKCDRANPNMKKYAAVSVEITFDEVNYRLNWSLEEVDKAITFYLRCLGRENRGQSPIFSN